MTRHEKKRQGTKALPPVSPARGGDKGRDRVAQNTEYDETRGTSRSTPSPPPLTITQGKDIRKRDRGAHQERQECLHDSWNEERLTTRQNTKQVNQSINHTHITNEDRERDRKAKTVVKPRQRSTGISRTSSPRSSSSSTSFLLRLPSGVPLLGGVSSSSRSVGCRADSVG